MFLPDQFIEDRDDEIRRIIEAYPLASLIAKTDDGIIADHIPLLQDGSTNLIGHIALANTLHKAITDGDQILAIFQAGDAYISPNWYPTKRDHQRHVPTWNYQAVHIRGTIHFSHDDKTKRAVVGKLTRHFEIKANAERPWKMADAPKDYMADMLSGIVAFEIAIESIEAKSKLSQNREPIDADGAMRGLAERGDETMVAAMTRARKDR